MFKFLCNSQKSYIYIFITDGSLSEKTCQIIFVVARTSAHRVCHIEHKDIDSNRHIPLAIKYVY